MANSLSTNYSRFIIVLMFISTAIQAVSGYARDASMGFKMILSLLCWASIILSLLQKKHAKQELGKVKLVYVAIASVIVISVLHSLLFGVAYAGNKYFVLFGNMYGALNIVCFFFVTSMLSAYDLKFLRNITIAYTCMSIVLLLLNYSVTIDSYFLIYPLTYAMLFVPYVKQRTRVFVVLGMLLSYFAFIGGGRQAVLFWAFNIAAYMSYKWLPKKTVCIGSIIAMLLPWILLLYSIWTGESIFEVLSGSMTSSEDGLNTDTRTFLYLETYTDFAPQSWLTILFGKGALAYYDSDWFSTYNRLGVEIPILEWMLQAGVVYVLLFTIICFVAVVRLYKCGNSNLCKIASVLIASYYFNCFVSNLNGCNISIMAFWFLIYLSNNSRMCEMDDFQWKKVLS